MAFVESNPHHNETNEIDNENAPTKHKIKLKISVMHPKTYCMKTHNYAEPGGGTQPAEPGGGAHITMKRASEDDQRLHGRSRPYYAVR